MNSNLESGKSILCSVRADSSHRRSNGHILVCVFDFPCFQELLLHYSCQSQGPACHLKGMDVGLSLSHQDAVRPWAGTWDFSGAGT